MTDTTPYLRASSLGVSNGIATLDGTGNVPADQLANAGGGGGTPFPTYRGTGSPEGHQAATKQGETYLDTVVGGLYLFVGQNIPSPVTSGTHGWIQIMGPVPSGWFGSYNTDLPTVGGLAFMNGKGPTGGSPTLMLLGDERGADFNVGMSDLPAQLVGGSGNGVYWTAANGDGNQEFIVETGPGGLYELAFDENGMLLVSGPIMTGLNGSHSDLMLWGGTGNPNTTIPDGSTPVSPGWGGGTTSWYLEAVPNQSFPASTPWDHHPVIWVHSWQGYPATMGGDVYEWVPLSDISVQTVPFTSNAYAFQWADQNHYWIANNGASPATLTIPGGWPVGAKLTIVQTGTGKISLSNAAIQCAGGFTNGTTGCRTQYSEISLKWIGGGIILLSGDFG